MYDKFFWISFKLFSFIMTHERGKHQRTIALSRELELISTKNTGLLPSYVTCLVYDASACLPSRKIAEVGRHRFRFMTSDLSNATNQNVTT